jgi:hypothetical protein
VKQPEHFAGTKYSIKSLLIIFFSGLLHKEPGFRLGCRRINKMEEGAEELKAHPFFSQVAWKKLEAGKVNF